MEAKKPERTVPQGKGSYVFAGVIHWVTISAGVAALFLPLLILIRPEHNLLNPNIALQRIFDGASLPEVWAMSQAGSFPGARTCQLAWGDSWAMLLLQAGCAASLFALIPAAVYHIVKEKDWFCGILELTLSLLIALSAAGVLNIAAG